MATTVFLDPEGSEAGTIGTQTRSPTFDVAAAPATGTETNTIRLPLLTVACWRMDDARFAFNSSFIMPTARTEIALLRQVVKANPGSPLSIFGHADPTGDDAYNKRLSGRRARAVFAVLTRDTAIYEELFKDPGSEEGWGTEAVQVMLDALGISPGAIDGVEGPKTTEAVKQFQKDNGLTVDGKAGPDTRAKLFGAYMDFLCTDKDKDTIRLGGKDFLGGGTDPNGKVDYQGCSEFNPVLVFSKEEADGFKDAGAKAERDTENLPNRRVTAFLFKKGLKIAADKWPCPKFNEGTAACRAQFFSDGDKRRNPQDERRLYEETEDTFACGFYDRLSNRSPCEGSGKLSVFRLRLLDDKRDPIPKAAFQIIQGPARVRGAADDDGFVTVVARQQPSTLRVEWKPPPPAGGNNNNQARDDEPEFPFVLEIFIAPGDGEDGAFQRLHNVGYSFEKTIRERVLAFQSDFGRNATGDFKDIEKELTDWHDGGKKPAVTPTS